MSLEFLSLNFQNFCLLQLDVKMLDPFLLQLPLKGSGAITGVSRDEWLDSYFVLSWKTEGWFCIAAEPIYRRTCSCQFPFPLSLVLLLA